MEAIQQILIRESVVDNYIYLYKVDDFWIAYERSAFYLYSTCRVDHTFQYFDPKNSNPIAIAILNNNYRNLNSRLKIVEDTDEQLVLSCGTICKGFSQWKNTLSFFPNKDKYMSSVSGRQQFRSKELEYSL